MTHHESDPRPLLLGGPALALRLFVFAALAAYQSVRKPEADRLARLMADCTAIEWPGVGHLIHWLQPEALAKYTIGFLESL